MLERNCKHCGEKIIAITAHKLYCDENCRAAYFKKNHEGYRRNPKKLIVCKECGKEIQTGDTRKKFCSMECRRTYFNHKRLTTKEQKRICPICGNVFQPMQKRGVGKKYCSNKCRDRARYLRNSAIPDKKRFEYRTKTHMEGNWWPVLQRDKFTCQLCGKRLFPSQWTKTKRLIVHHKDGSGETSKANHDSNNLKTLCEQCHRLYHLIHLVEIEGQYFLKGTIFKKLDITDIKILP